MRIACQQTILMKYASFITFSWKGSNIWNCSLLQIIGGALWLYNTQVPSKSVCVILLPDGPYFGSLPYSSISRWIGYRELKLALNIWLQLTVR